MTSRTATTANGRFLPLFLPFCLLLLLWLASLSAPLVAQEPVLPPGQPDAEIGLTLFQERCANCHGPAGQGNGELSANLPRTPADYTDPAFRRTRIPAVMFSTLTNGLLESGMPPFGPESSNPISEENRWHLVAAIYTLATPPETIAAGQAVYEENCAACHGETGLGDGPDAAAAEAEIPDLTDVRYWFNRSNETVYNALENSGVPDHDYDLKDLERWDVVDYARTFSYDYVNPNAPVDPVSGATISGVVTNGANGALISGVDVLLRGFDQNFRPTVTMTTTVNADGSYLFELDEVNPDWVYLASARYQDLGFSSSAGQISRSEPDLALPIIVYESTTNPGVVLNERGHILLSFEQDTLLVDELYVFSNPSTEVFVGESGDPNAGTVRFALPEGAQNITFQRTFGSMDSSIPATEIIQLPDGSFADTFPLNPGGSALNLIVSYNLPYEEGMSISRPIFYDTASVSVIIPDRGVTLTGDAWADQGLQAMPGGSFYSYTQRNMAPGSDLVFALNGRPEQGAAPPGNMIAAPSNSTNELVVGGVVLLVVAGVALFLTTRRSTSAEDYDEEEAAQEQAEIDRLLLALVDLDDAHDAGEVESAAYEEQRQKMLAELAAIWPIG